MIKKQVRWGLIILLSALSLLFINTTWALTVDKVNNLTKQELGLETIEFARTPEEKALGLMNREKLCQQCAMLFIYDQLSSDAFWMKNTLISLDIIFIDQDGKVVALHENTEPLNTSKFYTSPVRYSYVLESNARFAKLKNIKVGTRLDITSLLSIN